MKEITVVSIIEAFVFFLPFCKLWFQVGAWKKEMEEKIQQTQNNVNNVNQTLNRLDRLLQETCSQLAVISAKVSLIIDNKIRQEE